MANMQVESDEFLMIMTELKLIHRKLDEHKKRMDENPRKTKLINEWVDTFEACRLLKVSRKSIERYRVEGAIPFTRIKKRVFYRLRDLEKFLQAGAVNMQSVIK